MGEEIFGTVVLGQCPSNEDATYKQYSARDQGLPIGVTVVVTTMTIVMRQVLSR